MDFNLKQWRFHHQQKQDESDLEQQQHQQQLQQQQTPSGSNSALPLFVSEITNNNNNNKSVCLSLSPISSSSSSSSICKMGSTSSCYFSLTQWQELELQALIYKHMLAGAAVPPQLLHLLNKTLLRSSPPPTLTPTYALHPFHHYSHYQSPLLQSGVGYWGRPGGSMDPEPGRCRRTDGKKWRCSRDVVAAHKYCDRHMHRGRNRSRKPVESSSSISTTTNTTTTASSAANSLIHSGTTTSHLNHRKRSLDVVGTENKGMFGMQNEVAMSREMKPDRVLRHFFDDWPRPLDHEAENAAEVHNTAPANLSISTNVSSDFSLKLATGHEEEEEDNNTNNNAERDLNQLNWASGWRGAGPMGGPLAEALRSSMAATTTDSSPTSVLHHLARNPKSDVTSYVSNC